MFSSLVRKRQTKKYVNSLSIKIIKLNFTKYKFMKNHDTTNISEKNTKTPTNNI